MKLWGIGGVLALAAVASAQGSAGGDQSASCSSTQNFRYLGCYGNVPNGDHAGFKYEVSRFTDNSRYYPGFNGDFLTIEMCLTACRGHGFKYAALYARYLCYCGTLAPQTPTALSNPNNNDTINECHVAPPSSNGCNGDPNQWCGSGAASDVYEDTSFPAVDLSTQAGNYQYIGCFTTQNPGNFFNEGFVNTPVSSTAACFTRCANLGYAYAGMTSPTECSCGTDFEVGQQAQSETSCNIPCNPGE